MNSLELLPTKQEIEAELARRSLLDFVLFTKPDYEVNWHHRLICETLDKFVRKEIKNLMVFMPPQHGKSELVSRRLPAYLLGLYPKSKIAGCSYAHSLASKFNRDVQRIIVDKSYQAVFPGTTLNSSNVRTDSNGSWLRNSDEFEVVGHGGGYISVGIGGGLTGNRVDYLIIDDPVKDAVEAKSRSFQQRNWEWWNTVAKSRLHNESQTIICNTRWDIDDLSGLLIKLKNKGKGIDWHILSLPAIKTQDNDNAYDPRELGEVLWPERHSKKRMLEIKESDPVTFNALYQQDPAPSEVGQVFNNWIEIDDMPEHLPSVYGLDWGYTNDPSVVVDIRKEGQNVYVDCLIYQKGLNNAQMANLIKSKGITREPIYADSAEPKSIDEVKMYGLKVKPAVKGRDSIMAGIQFIKQHKVHLTKRSKEAWDEVKYYQWELTADNQTTNKPRDFMNHFMDAFRYGLYSHYNKPEKWVV